MQWLFTLMATGVQRLVLDLTMLFLRLCISVIVWHFQFAPQQAYDARLMNWTGVTRDGIVVIVTLTQTICPVLMLLGLFTRLAVLILMAAILICLLLSNAADPGIFLEATWLYLSNLSVLLVMGPGKYAADHWLYQKLIHQEL